MKQRPARAFENDVVGMGRNVAERPEGCLTFRRWTAGAVSHSETRPSGAPWLRRAFDRVAYCASQMRVPLVLYWYEFRKAAAGAVEWTRHPIAEGSQMGTGLQLRVADVDGNGGLDVVAAGKSGLFIATRRPTVASR